MWTLDREAPLPLWLASSSTDASLVAATTRQGGISGPPYHALNLGRSTADRSEHVAENRRRVLAHLGIPEHRLATAGQVHGATVVRVAGPGHTPECDALVTTEPGLALAVTTADCMSLLLGAPGAVAAVHSGWRGTSAGMPAAALAAVCDAAGCGPERVSAYFGPCIRVCCYEVGADVAARFPAEAVRDASPRPYLDLPKAARLQLARGGVPDGSIFDSGACTACDPAWYYSYRRDGPESGRHWGLAAVRGSGGG